MEHRPVVDATQSLQGLVPGLWLCAVPLFVSGAAQGLSLPIINDNVALLGTPDDRAAILAVSETSVRVSQSVSPLLFSIISMKWLWDGAYASDRTAVMPLQSRFFSLWITLCKIKDHVSVFPVGAPSGVTACLLHNEPTSYFFRRG